MVWRTIVNGYPYKTPTEIGVDTIEEAYFVTQEAVYTVMNKRNMTVYRGVTDRGNKLVRAIDRLQNIGRNGGQNPDDVRLRVVKKGEYEKEGNYYYQTYTVTAEVDVKEYDVKIDSENLGGIFVSDTSGKAKTNFMIDEDFRIMVPKEQIQQKTEVQITVDAKCKTYPVFYGTTAINDTQDYALTYGIFGDILKDVKLTVNLNTGEIQIQKINAQTNQPIAGTTLELLNEKEKVVATATTDDKGMAIFENLYPGNYKIKETAQKSEIAPNPETIKVTVEYDNIINQVITNDYKKGNLKIIHVDEETKEPLSDTSFELYSKDWDEVIGTYTTDENGEISIKELRTGEYELRTKVNKDGYENEENQSISIEEGQTIEITVTSRKIPSAPDNPDKEPTTPDQEPDNPDKEPTNPDQEPDSPDKEPTTPNQEPDNSDKEPTTPNQEPDNPNKEPTSSDKDQTTLAQKEVKKLPKTGF